ncbi:sensor histidine kinase [Flavobacterium subsaxonicum]|uniref:histidine kinase n=1 Tax=Flavobacterium subsaxonicum WB 4.1-42 = DSM 21790 TaxID=1121898 RepID=A0A0A2MIZ2_9FLAO|nr:HAMP domain-containing sensor histidine kinase [Flavobacterium subsaxonicum]KGO91463.1 histidine kinase [Flavobacterium subsaxonicum WB 4.1-42 = DSM 21790]
MQITDKRSLTRWIIIGASFFTVLFIVWNTYYLFQIFRAEEHMKMELWAASLNSLNNADPETEDVTLPSKILENNTSIPIILTDKDNNVLKTANISDAIAKDSILAKEYIEDFKSQNQPIVMNTYGEAQYIYYGSSTLLNVLKYYPFALALIIVLFSTVIYNFYRATKAGAQNRLWAGMAKETAHQIGTPLSSLLGWIEIMRVDDVDPTTIAEVEKDVLRLQTIADRFSKIGSEPLLEERDIVAETEKSFEYLRSRASKQVEFSFKAPNHAIPVMLNPELHSWTVENLVKNAIDAMKGKGKLDVSIEEKDRFVKIKVSDSGKGIPKAQFRKVFEPGFTTKRRGWGLGLSLTRRIVEEYHKGKIKVLHSEIGKGTTMQASFKRV